MGQYNLGVLNNMSIASLVVSAGDPETLILNHSTKNTVYIGNSPSVGSGNLLDATPLDPYASIVVNGKQDVYAIAAVPSLPASVYTFPNSIAWTPKAIQPNIVDPTSPVTVTAPTTAFTLNVPPTAQALAIYNLNAANVTSILIVGVQSGIIYFNGPPPSASSATPYLWVPVLSDADAQVSVTVSLSSGSRVLELVWIMSGPPPVVTPGSANVNIQAIGGIGIAPASSLPVINQVGNSLNVNAAESGTWNVNSTEVSKQMFANQTPQPFDLSLAANATAVILAAFAGVTIYLHDIRVEVVTAASIGYAMLQDTNGSNFANIFLNANAAADSPGGNNNFHGAPLPNGVGLQLKNNTVNAQRYVGYVSYSK